MERVLKTLFTETKDLKMRVAAYFILLISLAVAFTLEKEHPVFEDEPDEPVELNELDEDYCCTHICFVTLPESGSEVIGGYHQWLRDVILFVFKTVVRSSFWDDLF